MRLQFTYECTTCGRRTITDKIVYLCPECESDNKPGQPLHGVMKIVYDYDTIKRDFGAGNLFYNLKNEWFFDLLPIHEPGSVPGLRVGNTPFYEVDEFDGKLLNGTLLIKNDYRNPTFSLKDRATLLVSAFAKEKGISKIITASTGNAGSSLAGICAAQGQKAIVIVPEHAPTAKMLQILMYGATVIPVKGNYDDAYDLSLAISVETGIYNRNTAYNPLTIEGKKLVAYEIWDDLDGLLPDHIFIPVGDGVIISAVYKGFEDLMMLGITDRMPTIIAVQAEGSSNFVDNLERTEFKSKKSKTIADSISVDVPRNFYMAADYIRKYDGKGVLVGDDEILEASLKLARNTGMFAEPAGAASLAGFLKFMEKGLIPDGTSSLILVTGSGLKDPDAVKNLVKFPKAIVPETDKALKLLGI